MADLNPPGAMVAGGKEASIHGECLRIEQHTPPGSLNRRERRRRLTREMTPAISGRQWSGGPHRYRAIPGMKEEDIAAGGDALMNDPCRGPYSAGSIRLSRAGRV